jgi:hypothetical protein
VIISATLYFSLCLLLHSEATPTTAASVISHPG